MGFLPTFFNYTVQGDTHAANLTGSNTQAASLSGSLSFVNDTGQDAGNAIFGGANAVTNANMQSGTFTAETTLQTANAATPSQATNRIVITAGLLLNNPSGGTTTLRIKESTTTLASTTTNSGGASNVSMRLWTVVADASAAAHTYLMSLQCTTSVSWICAFLMVVPISYTDSHAAALTGTDTHAASLSGSSGTCQI